MKKKHFKRNKKISEKFAIDQAIEEKKEETISFSLTPRETKLYQDWIDGLWDGMEIDDTEDSHVFYPKIQFEPYEMGMMITAIVGKKEIILRMACEDDAVGKKK